MSHSVGQVSALSGVTVRTLHHYDEIGLLRPNERNGAGYRRYDDADLERLQQILFYRELGFALEDIATILADPQADADAHLRRQHQLLTERIGRLQAMVAAVELAMEAQHMGIALTPEERFEIFGDFNPDEYAEEAEERWGGTETYQESQRRVASYTKQDWLRMQTETADQNQRWVTALTTGLPADSEQAMDLAEEHRQLISRWFYDCTYEIQRGLGDTYVADERFKRNYETQAEGLAQYIRDAIHANAERVAAS